MWGKHHSFVQRERERNPQTGGLTRRHSVRHTATQRTWAKLGFVHLLIAGALLECSQESVECCLLKVAFSTRSQSEIQGPPSTEILLENKPSTACLLFRAPKRGAWSVKTCFGCEIFKNMDTTFDLSCSWGMCRWGVFQ